MKNIIVIGAGGHGRSVAELILQGEDFKLVGFVDDSFTPDAKVWSYPILGKISDLPGLVHMANWAIVAIGNNIFREKLFLLLDENNFSIASIFHPKSIISPSAIIGEGSVIMAGGIIGTEAKLGKGVIVNSGAIVDHHCIVEDFGHLGVNACMAGGAQLGKHAWLQAGGSLGYGVIIDKCVTVGVGKGIAIDHS